MSILKTKPISVAVKEAVAIHNKKLGGAKGRLHQQSTRLAAEAKARADEAATSRAASAVAEIDQEIATAAAEIQALRGAANDPRGGRGAVEANREMTRLLQQVRDLREERRAFVARCC